MLGELVGLEREARGDHPGASENAAETAPICSNANEEEIGPRCRTDTDYSGSMKADAAPSEWTNPNFRPEVLPVRDFITDPENYDRPPDCSRSGRCAEGHVPHPANVKPERGRCHFSVRPRGRRPLPDDDAAAPPGEE